MSKISIAGILLLVMGCASVPESECRRDWRRVGFLDGRQGQNPRSLSKYEGCTKYSGVKSVRVAYSKGRQQGLRKFCTFRNGKKVGKRGESFRGVCPPTLASEFLRGYTQGQRIIQLRAQHQSLVSDIGVLQRQLASESNPQQRARLQHKMQSLQAVQGETVKELQSLSN